MLGILTPTGSGVHGYGVSLRQTASAKTSQLTLQGIHREAIALSSLNSFILEFARHLGERDAIESFEFVDQRCRALLDILRGRRALLIWDNLETLSEEEQDIIAEFLRKLAAPNKAIVTSRHRVGETAVTIRLDRLLMKEALDLIAEEAHRQPRVSAGLQEASDETIQALYEAAGGNPLAIRLALGLVAQKGYSLAGALKRLRDAARSQDLYAFLFSDLVSNLAKNDRTTLYTLVLQQVPITVDVLSD